MRGPDSHETGKEKQTDGDLHGSGNVHGRICGCGLDIRRLMYFTIF
jgi:hypothetical protein